MRRRNYLHAAGLLGLTVVAGCAGDDTQEAVDITETTTATDAPDQTTESTTTEAETETEPETETETGTETETETTTSTGEPEVAIGDHELVVDEGEFTTDVYVAATVTNEGDAPAGIIELTAQWYDADGNYLDDDRWFLQSLGAGETWAARVYYLGGDAETIDDYEFSGEFETEPPQTNPEGLEVVESKMNVGEDEVVISGTVENNRDEAASYIEATSKIYDADGIVLGDEWTNVNDVPAGETWAFELTWHGRDRVDQAADHTVLITDTTF